MKSESPTLIKVRLCEELLKQVEPSNSDGAIEADEFREVYFKIRGWLLRLEETQAQENTNEQS